MNLKNCETTQKILNPGNHSNQKIFNSPAGSWLLSIPFFSSPVSETLFRLAVLGLILLSLALSAHACGPFFPNNLLSSGDQAVLAAPIADFARELSRLKLMASRFHYVAATNSHAAQSFDAEMADLAAALKQAKISPEESALIVEGHRVNRTKLGDYFAAYEQWELDSKRNADAGPSGDLATPPPFPTFSAVPGLPDEFADYFAGAAALRQPGADNSFREVWERLLARPAAERKYKSTWAAFMLGRTSQKSDDDKAIEYFKQTRELAQHGFPDSLGLAAAALGLEAQIELGRKHFKRALELYLEQYATGDWSAINSLRWTAEQALGEGGEQLAALAAVPNSRAVITAWFICDQDPHDQSKSKTIANQVTLAWLEAVEAAGGQDVEAAERLALAAYQAGEFEVAQRWVNRARQTPVAQWLQVKLFLRAGKIPAAAALLAKVADQLPLVSGNELSNSTEFAESLHMGANGFIMVEDNTARRQLLGELGVLHLSRREFTEALDALLRAGFWPDAAYVAERVLTTDELKAYVDREWPASEAVTETPAKADADGEIPAPDTRCEDIRYLLARRLTRELRAKEARDYFPAQWQRNFDELLRAVDAGWTESAPADRRAKSLFTAAVIARTNGMELLGTELAPDWHLYGGDFEGSLTWETRATNELAAKVNFASADEIRRATRHDPDPNARFHYRYQAAFLAWEAAKIMPDNADETARVLCTAGTWLKDRDPKTADMFYKALVRRCCQTAIGAQADRMRWFPILDADGNPKPYQPRPKEIVPPTSTEDSEKPSLNPFPEADNHAIAPATHPMPGKFYTIHKGDSILAIASAVSGLGQSLTPKEILQANPDLDPARLKIGQKILIPTSEKESDTDEVNSGPANER